MTTTNEKLLDLLKTIAPDAPPGTKFECKTSAHGYSCTRVADHNDWHAGYNSEGQIVAAWDNYWSYVSRY